MTYTTPTPSTVSAGDTFPASAYNIISNDIQDHESRIKTGIESYTTTQKNALTGVATGTTIYDSTLGLVQMWNGTIWTVPTTNRVGVKAYITSNQLHNQNVSWDATEWDTDPAGSMWSSGAPTDLLVRTSGLYSFVFYGRWIGTSVTGTPAIGCNLNVNGNSKIRSTFAATATLNGDWAFSGLINLAATNVVTFKGTVVGAGTPVNLQAGTGDFYDRTTAILTLIAK